MPEDTKPWQPRAHGRFFVAGWFGAIVIMLFVTAWLIVAHGARLTDQSASLEQERVLGPRVLVAPVQRAPQTRSLELPGTIRGFIETPVYAKIPGYLKVIK